MDTSPSDKVPQSNQFTKGARVMVTRGGFRDTCGTVRGTWPNAEGGTTVDVTLDSGILFYGDLRCLQVIQ